MGKDFPPYLDLPKPQTNYNKLPKEPLQHIKLSEPKIDFDMLENGNHISKFQIKVMAKINDLNDKVICDEIIKFAREQGITNLFLMDKEFIKSALTNEIKRREKPQTNFDKITSSVENLAELLAGVVDCNVCPCGNKNCVGFTTCKERIKEWLQSEVQGNV